MASKEMLGSFMLAGCILVQGVAASAESPASVTANSEQAVRAFEAEVMNAYNRGDPDEAARHYATDAFVHIPGQPAARGRQAVAANIARFMKDPNFKLGYSNERLRVAASNDVAYTRGRLQITYTDPKTRKAQTIESGYFLLMRKDPEFGWQVAEDISF